MTEKTIVIGGQTVAVKPIPLGVLRKVVPAFNRVGVTFASGAVDEAVISDCVFIIAAGIGKPVEEVEQMPMGFDELPAALEVIAEVAGLKPAGEQPGEPAPSSTTASGTESTQA
jgi:hypothetical protein